MLTPLAYEHTFLIGGLPKQWLLKQPLFDVEFPSFPMVYVHNLVDGERVYGFPISINLKSVNGETVEAKVLFVCNIDLVANQKAREVVQIELNNRLGMADRVTKADIDTFCSGGDAKKYKEFLVALWERAERPFGKELQYGRLYERVESIIRFVAAFQPKTGRQSEIRMKYNFFSSFGEKVEVVGNWSFLDFNLVPTAQEIRAGTLDEFPKFKLLFSAMSKLWREYYTKEIVTGSGTYRSMESAWESNKESFIRDVSGRMLTLEGANRFTQEEKMAAETLVDDFNRHVWRAAFFIWSIMTLHEQGFDSWTKPRFVDFYFMRNGKGISPKVVACFLQQGFSNDEAIPVDTWVESFQEHALGIEDRLTFINTFKKIGKLERLIWLASQANKINLRPFFYTLWCTRYGTRGNTALRGANPIACYECELRSCCQGYKKVMDQKVRVLEEAETKFDAASLEGRLKLQGTTLDGDEQFLCLVNKGVPTKVYRKANTRKDGICWKLVDEHSAYLLQADQKTNQTGKSVTVDTLIKSLPPMNFDERKGPLNDLRQPLETI